jgi:hypothetical protein
MMSIVQWVAFAVGAAVAVLGYAVWVFAIAGVVEEVASYWRRK